MAVTKITDLITPEVYLNYMKEDYPERNRLLRSGIAVSPPEQVQSQMNAGGTVINMPFWDDLARGDPDIMSDDDTTSATAAKVGADKDQAIKHYWHKSWSAMDVAGMVATGGAKDPVRHILSRIGAWWEAAEQAALIATCKGVFADNDANDSDDMMYSIYSDVVDGSLTAANRISGAAVRRARATSGDFMDEYSAIAVHSAVYVNMLDNDEIEFIKPSEAKEVPVFQGMEVIVDDTMPVTAGTNNPAYTCYLFGRGAFAFTDGASADMVPFETDRDPATGNGGGQDTIHSRRHVLLHPRGIKFTSSSVAGLSPTTTEMAAAANWDRVYNRKNIRLAQLTVNA
jgi:hypothetical protein